MGPKAASPFLCFVLFLLCSSAAQAFNITRLLGQYPEFSTFNELLTKTKVAAEINKRLTITVLVIDNAAASAIAGKPDFVLKTILSNHVILDYYSLEKLSKLPKKTALLTTLYQSSGVAEDKTGFLNVSVVGDGEVAFGSADKGAPLNAKLVNGVAAQPFNISVLQVTQAIIAPGVDFSAPSPVATPPSSAPRPLIHVPPSASRRPKAPSPGDDDEVLAPDAESPTDADAPADAPGNAPADAPSDAPAADELVSSPPAADDDDAADDDAAAPANSGSTRTQVSTILGLGVVVGLLSSMMAL
ncbi:Fasciclin-like arabinogalactan protein [Quillaja saponaria]|uniref:Fasciclin-like arabinogalactan protein n=1 Tax=Quillaja saponaria TaxID=32244 RepID=A0AAD7LXC0_QUISA|nr:Fasciclin-like arabinogalactan protein [Quillaja saponaria]